MAGSDIIVMGVSGTGKSTLGRALAASLSRPFVEGDDHHSDANRAKMAGGTALTNADRDGWIAALAGAVNAGPPAVVACSALNAEVRGWIAARFDRPVRFVHLSATALVIARRLAGRAGHFFDPALLDSQLAALEPPRDAITVCAEPPLDAVLAAVRAALDDQG